MRVMVVLMLLVACGPTRPGACPAICTACCTAGGACVESCGPTGQPCGGGVLSCEKGQSHLADEHDCIGVPSPWECGSPGMYCGDRGPCPDAGVCVSYRCSWPADAGP
jgi:hypothetical protein